MNVDSLTQWREQSTEQLVRSTALYVALYGIAVVFMIPYLWMLSTSFKTKEELFSQSAHLVPQTFTLRWFRVLFNDTLVVQWTINTFIVAIGTTVLVLVFDSLIAFSLTQLEWPGKGVVFSLIVASFMVPSVVNLIPTYTIISDMGLLNNYVGVILPLTAGPLGVFMLVQFFRDFPNEIREAAIIDGFTSFQVYSRIVLPMMKSALSALGLFVFIWSWNSFLWPLIILQDEVKYTLPVGLVTLRDVLTGQQPGIVLASALVASIPLFVLFTLFQNQIINAVKAQGTTG